MRNGHGPLPPLRPELRTAYDEMKVKKCYFAYAICRTYDDQAWEVNVRQGGVYTVLDDLYLDHDKALAAGEVWLLEQSDRDLSDDEAVYRLLWEGAS